MWNDDAKVCNQCYERIDEKDCINPAADLHFHNTTKRPCFHGWLTIHLKSAVKAKEKSK